MRTLCSAACLALVVILGGATPSFSLTQDEISNYKGADRQKMLEEGAKKEGEVAWYATFNVELAVTPLGAAFEKKYPFLKVNFIRATSSQAIQRAQAEFRAKSVRVDIMAAGSTDSLSGSGLLQPYWGPVLAEYPEHYVDPKREWVANWAGYNGIAWNTKLVKPEEVPKTWEDLANLDPKFRGKIVWGASPTAGAPRVITHWRQMWGEDKALAFVKKFAALDVRTSLGSTDNMLDQMAVGEYAFVIGGAVQLAARRKADGANVDGSLLDPAIVRTSAIGLLTGAPHPHAAVLFMDFVLSKEGQTVLKNGQYIPAHPAVDPLPELAMAVPRLNKVKELPLSGEKEAEMAGKSTDIMKAHFRGE